MRSMSLIVFRMASAPFSASVDDLLGEAGGLVGVALDLVDGDVHLVHRGAGLLGGERERVDVLGDLLDGVRHLLDGG